MSLCVFVSALSLVCVSLCVLYWYSIGTLVCSLATVESEISEINGRHITVLCTACLTDPGQAVPYEVKKPKAFTKQSIVKPWIQVDFFYLYSSQFRWFQRC